MIQSRKDTPKKEETQKTLLLVLRMSEQYKYNQPATHLAQLTRFNSKRKLMKKMRVSKGICHLNRFQNIQARSSKDKTKLCKANKQVMILHPIIGARW